MLSQKGEESLESGYLQCFKFWLSIHTMLEFDASNSPMSKTHTFRLHAPKQFLLRDAKDFLLQ